VLIGRFWGLCELVPPLTASSGSRTLSTAAVVVRPRGASPPTWSLVLTALVVGLPAAAQPQAGVGTQWRLVEELRVDGSREQFSAANAALVVRSDGTIAFADRARYQLRFYDRAGRFLSALGGRGGGPGEFIPSGRFTNILSGTVGDSLWYADPNGRRLTVVSAARRIVRTFSLPQLPRHRASPEDAPASPVFTPHAFYRDGGMVGVRGVTSRSAPRNWQEDLVIVDSSGAVLRVLATLNAPRFVSVRNPATGRDASFPVPRSPVTRFSVAQDGSRIAVLSHDLTTRPTRSYLHVFGRTGDTLAARTFSTTSVEASADDTERALAAVERDLRAPSAGLSDRYVTAVLRALRDSMPRFGQPFSQIRLGLDDTIWLAPSSGASSGGDHEWLVLDGRGQTIAQIALPPPQRFVLGAASRAHVWGIVSDRDGVPSIVRYRVQVR
jgi:hypothetical protein